jgi:transposase-like protein
MQYQRERLDDGNQRVVRNGYLPEKDIQTGIGNITIKQPRVRDRKPQERKIEFCPDWIPKYMRRTKTIDSLLPLLYLKGISTGDFQAALEPLLGKDATNIFPAVISRMKSGWLSEYQQFKISA